jgi:FdhD protein
VTEATIDVTVQRMQAAGVSASQRDVLAVEEPLEIRLETTGGDQRDSKTISVTMRTPGHDAELAVGFLFTEGIVGEHSQIEDVGHSGPSGNVVRVRLASNAAVDLARLERHFYMTSSCGVCGKTSIDALRTATRYPLPPWEPVVDAAVIHHLPRALRDAQAIFDSTGGLHASALFDTAGRLRSLREDVGRHNALDKVIGAELLAGRLPAHDKLLVVSGRASFELVQKAVMAGIPILVAVGAPSSLAVQLATCTGMTLVGFARDGRFNIYAGNSRVRARVNEQTATAFQPQMNADPTVCQGERLSPAR